MRNISLDVDREDLKWKRTLRALKFVGELYKFGVLGAELINDTFSTIRNYLITSKDQEIVSNCLEGSCILMKTLGRRGDPHGKIIQTKIDEEYNHLMKHLESITQGPTVTSKMTFLVKNLLEVRAKKWINGPISKVENVKDQKKTIGYFSFNSLRERGIYDNLETIIEESLEYPQISLKRTQSFSPSSSMCMDDLDIKSLDVDEKFMLSELPIMKLRAI